MACVEVYQHQAYKHPHGDNYLIHNALRVGLASKKPTFFDLGILIVLRSSLLFISFSYLSAPRTLRCLSAKTLCILLS